MNRDEKKTVYGMYANQMKLTSQINSVFGHGHHGHSTHTPVPLKFCSAFPWKFANLFVWPCLCVCVVCQLCAYMRKRKHAHFIGQFIAMYRKWNETKRFVDWLLLTLSRVSDSSIFIHKNLFYLPSRFYTIYMCRNREFEFFFITPNYRILLVWRKKWPIKLDDWQ